jgi:predicted DNA-binding transcriptional regulator YafY
MGAKTIYERFVWFDSMVRQKRYPNATRLAEEFEMSLKTAQRDIEFMRDRLSCPLEYDKQRKGYSYNRATFSLPLIYLSTDELSSLLIAKKMLQDISGGELSEEVCSVVDKITGILQRHIVTPGVIDDKLSFHLVEYTPAPDEIFRKLLEGCIKNKTISFTYFSPAVAVKGVRTVDPYHLFNYMGTWHLIGYCHDRRELRDFNLGRVSDVTVLDKYFTIKNNFSFNDYFQSTFGLYKGESAEEVTLRFTPEKSRWIKGQLWHKDQKETVHPNGSLELSFPVADFSEIAREILKHGAGVEVIKPQSLRELIKSEALRITELYQ